ncbi:MAG: alanine--tRNA ligase [Chloroflexota bacterium]
MNGDEIRQTFIDFFKERGHLQLTSMPVVPSDPTITTLFTIAGMQQMIPYFLGRQAPPSRRIVNVQKTVRTVDIEEVGDDSHLTFLEMLGNFSVGDYWKRDAIALTWEFLTGRMALDAGRWYATIYPGDAEARDAWIAAGLPPERIGETEDNVWAQGPTGPCGTDSEIFYDRGPEFSCGRSDCRPENACCDRFLEIWNNVFMDQFREETGELRPLPTRNIDTGLGFERLVMLEQNARSVYDTDLFQRVIHSVTDVSGVVYGESDAGDTSMRIIADHARAIAVIVADGVMPAAEGRGYVLRRLIRRAALRGRTLGITRPFLNAPVDAAIDSLGAYWSEVANRRHHITRIVEREESQFLQTLARGLTIFEELATRAERESRTIPGTSAFTLYDTHGFPFEITMELAADRGLSVDREGFEEELRKQRLRGQQDRKDASTALTSSDVYVQVADEVPATAFTGYTELETTSNVIAIIAAGQPVSRAQTGDVVELVLASTPFYAESGGQVGDTGLVQGDSGVARVTNTVRAIASLIVHVAEVTDGTLSVGDIVQASVDAERRLHILPHHSGTHLLHKALQEVLGPEATQAGSLVAPDRLRFDFHWPRALTEDEVREIQDRVNAAIWANLPVRQDVMSYDEAVRDGAMALFGEKYGDRVRVVSIGDWSKELCGGTHVTASGDIGLLLITGESAIGAGIRRIEALAGAAAYTYVNDMRAYVGQIAEVLGSNSDALLSRAHHLVAESRRQEKENAALQRRLANLEAEVLIAGSIPVNGLKIVAGKVATDNREYLRVTSDAIKSRLDQGIVILASVVDGKPQYIAAVTRNLHDRGFNARDILQGAIRTAQGGEGGAGGGPEFAQGGGRDAGAVQKVLETAVDLIKQRAEN